MNIRLHKRPGLYHVAGGHTYVGTWNKRWWFIVTAESHSPVTGADYPGYLALWRFKQNYRTKALAEEAAKKWLGVCLT